MYMKGNNFAGSGFYVNLIKPKFLPPQSEISRLNVGLSGLFMVTAESENDHKSTQLDYPV